MLRKSDKEAKKRKSSDFCGQNDESEEPKRLRRSRRSLTVAATSIDNPVFQVNYMRMNWIYSTSLFLLLKSGMTIRQKIDRFGFFCGFLRCRFGFQFFSQLKYLNFEIGKIYLEWQIQQTENDRRNLCFSWPWIYVW